MSVQNGQTPGRMGTLHPHSFKESSVICTAAVGAIRFPWRINLADGEGVPHPCHDVNSAGKIRSIETGARGHRGEAQTEDDV